MIFYDKLNNLSDFAGEVNKEKLFFSDPNFLIYFREIIHIISIESLLCDNITIYYLPEFIVSS